MISAVYSPLSGFALEADMTGAQAYFHRLGDALDSPYAALLDKMGGEAASSVEANFLQSGRPQEWTPLADATVAGRKMRLKKNLPLVAGLTTPLRVSDALRRAASAEESGVPGSEITHDGWQWQNEVTLPYAARQNFGFQTGDEHSTPAREFLFFQERDEEDFTDRLLGEVQRRTIQAER